jgi:TolB-like protein/class 3 adenylate cyclase/Tfp pilus assembly protein PilF
MDWPEWNMATHSESDLQFAIGHVLFIDIAGYSKLLINEQSELIRQLKEVVRGTEQFRLAEAEGKLLRLPTGDGGALVFRNTQEAPVLCALEISKALKNHPQLRVRMGVHSGPVNEVADLNEQMNVAGAGINIAQRVMDCGDAGHILLSKHVAEDLEDYARWRPYLHELGECETKHGGVISVVNLYDDEVGNPQLPEKLKEAQQARAAKATASRPAPPTFSRRLVLIGAAALSIAACGLGVWFYSRQAAVTPAAPAKSIAVLPFDNLSRDPDNAYFVEGVQEEILTRLAKIADLKVISRTSTQQFQSKPANLAEIGKQLGVANLLEGSVQKIADAVHINVQLIRAATDEHIWAESYNRKLDDVFGVEGEVASAIADQLKAKLTGAEEKAVTEKPTQNVAAYDAYLHGLSIEREAYLVGANQQAAADYAQAVQLDPKFALAWAHLGAIRSYLFFNGVDPTTNSATAVKQAAEEAMALQPDLAEAWIAQGAYRYRILRDFAGALKAFEEGQKRLPNSAFVYEYMVYVERRLGLWKEAVAHYQKAAELDPRSVALFVSMGNELLDPLRRFDEAHAALDRALEISPNDAGALAAKASVLQDEGRLDEAAKTLARIHTNLDEAFVVLIRAIQATFERRFGDAIAIIEAKVVSAKPGEPLNSIQKLLLVRLGYCQEWAGRTNEARATFARAIQAIKPSPDFVVTPDNQRLPVFLALAYAGLGDKEHALEQARRAVTDYATDAGNKPYAEARLAQIQARFGDLDAAIAALPHLLEVPAGITTADLRFNPFWDSLRKDPHFQKLCAEKQP